MEGLNRELPGLVSLLHFPLASLRANLRQLVASFSLSPHTITFRYAGQGRRGPFFLFLFFFLTSYFHHQFLTGFVDRHVRFFMQRRKLLEIFFR
jgi:hypothetical protein